MGRTAAEVRRHFPHTQRGTCCHVTYTVRSAMAIWLSGDGHIVCPQSGALSHFQTVRVGRKTLRAAQARGRGSRAPP